MGREVKRVPLDFDHPVGKTWTGYLNPHYVECEPCDGIGTTLAMKRMEDLVSLLMLSGSDARRGKCHPYFYDAPLHHTRGKACPGLQEVTIGLAGRDSGSPLGHDSIDNWRATKKILAAAGLPDSWGTCTHCDGHGIPREHFAAYDTWARSEPPEGDGWQVWETVSEGSPISPVFATPEELARHMATTRWGADNGTSYETWLAFICGPGWAPSLVGDASGLRTGVQAMAAQP